MAGSAPAEILTLASASLQVASAQEAPAPANDIQTPVGDVKPAADYKPLPAGDGFIAQTSRSKNDRPDNLVGLDNLQRSLGAGPIRTTFPLVSPTPFTPAEAQHRSKMPKIPKAPRAPVNRSRDAASDEPA